MKKYELTKECKIIHWEKEIRARIYDAFFTECRTVVMRREAQVSKVYRIKALEDFGDVKAGSIGGWLESKENLSQEGTCWVYDDAKVFGDARVADDARIYGNAEVAGKAKVFDSAKVCGNAKVNRFAQIYGTALVYGDALITDTAYIGENAQVGGGVVISGDSWVGRGRKLK